MCRNIKPLFNFDPPATEEEIHDAALQYVRKLSGFQQPSQVNQAAFEEATQMVAVATKQLIGTLTTQASPRDRDAEAAKARARAIKRFGA